MHLHNINDNVFFNNSLDSLSHHGIPGMKWGVRNEETLRKYNGGSYKNMKLTKLDKYYLEKETSDIAKKRIQKIETKYNDARHALTRSKEYKKAVVGYQKELKKLNDKYKNDPTNEDWYAEEQNIHNKYFKQLDTKLSKHADKVRSDIESVYQMTKARNQQVKKAKTVSDLINDYKSTYISQMQKQSKYARMLSKFTTNKTINKIKLKDIQNDGKKMYKDINIDNKLTEQAYKYFEDHPKTSMTLSQVKDMLREKENN